MSSELTTVNGYQKINLLLAVLSLFSQLSPQVVNADDFNTIIESANLIPDNGGYRLNADINFKLSPTAVEALNNSISLVWNIRLKLYQERPYLWDKKVLDYSVRYRVRYHALLNMYQIKNETNGEVRRFFSHVSAFKAMGEIRNLMVVRQGEILHPENIRAVLKVQFDRESLPLPLRPISYFDLHWYLSSDCLQWPLQK